MVGLGVGEGVNGGGGVAYRLIIIYSISANYIVVDKKQVRMKGTK